MPSFLFKLAVFINYVAKIRHFSQKKKEKFGFFNKLSYFCT